MIPIAIAYSGMNYIGCITHNVTAIYWFLDWGKPTVYLLLIILMAFGVGLHYLLAVCTVHLKKTKKLNVNNAEGPSAPKLRGRCK